MSNTKNENGTKRFATIPALRPGMSFLAQMGLTSWMEQNCSLQSETEQQCGHSMVQEENKHVHENSGRIKEKTLQVEENRTYLGYNLGLKNRQIDNHYQCMQSQRSWIMTNTQVNNAGYEIDNDLQDFECCRGGCEKVI
jgi:hypothetical protein